MVLINYAKTVEKGPHAAAIGVYPLHPVFLLSVAVSIFPAAIYLVLKAWLTYIQGKNKWKIMVKYMFLPIVFRPFLFDHKKELTGKRLMRYRNQSNPETLQ